MHYPFILKNRCLLLEQNRMRNNNKRLRPPNSKSPLPLTSQSPPPLLELFSDVISLKLLQFLEEQMQPHYHHFNVVELALLVDKYICAQLLKREEAKAEQIITGSLPLPIQPKLGRMLSENRENGGFEVGKEQLLEMLMEQIKAIFLYYATHAVSYEMINEYVYNQQLSRLSNGEVDEDYVDIGEKRVRIDENLKLCIMPLSEQGIEVKTTKIKQIVFRQNSRGAELESIFTITNHYIRCLRIKPELIGIAADFSRKGESNTCWYQYEPELIKPKRTTVSVGCRVEETQVVSSTQLKELKATNATNIDEKFSDQLLSILKACASDNLMGMISLDQSFSVEPIGKGKNRIVQGYIGNLLRDVPPQINLEGGKEKYEEILLFHSYSDTEWVILSSKFLYFYRIPLPAQNIILKEQNNLHRANSYKPNPLLLMCQRLPKGCMKAIALNRPYLCLMLENNCIMVIKLVFNNLGLFQGRTSGIELNYYKITNKIYNDIQFKCICFNSAFNNIFLSDFGAYLIRVTFNRTYGDIEEEGITHDRTHSTAINHQMLRNSYSQLKSRSAQKGGQRGGVIEEVGEEEQDNQGEDEGQYIQVFYLKPSRSQQKHLLSLYKKQSSSPHTVVIKNQTRQVISYLTTNHNFNTLITYEAESYQKNTASEFQGQKYRQWGNNNKIKLWDIRHMTIYKSYDVSLELSFIELRANGLFALTADRGYLVFYPFNEDRKAIIGAAEQKILDVMSREVTQELEEVYLQRNSLYFYTLTSWFNKHSNLKVHRTHLYRLQLQKYPQIHLLQTLPSEITALAASSRLYVLQNAAQGVEASQLHIYNRLGLKEEVVVFSNPEAVNAEGKLNQQNYSQQYKFLRRIEHEQFEVVVWNSDSLKLLGNSPEASYTLVFSSHKINHVAEGVERVRVIKDIQVVGHSMVVYCQNTTRIRERHGPDAISRASETSERRSMGKTGAGRVHESTEWSMILISNQIDRVTYRLEHISARVKVLHMFNQLLLTREEAGEFDLVKILDVGEPGSLLEKVLFCAKFRRNTMERVRAGDLRGSSFYELNTERNSVLQEVKEYSVRKSISLEDTKVAVTESNKLMVLLVLKVQTHYTDLVTRKALRSEVEFMVYARNISDELCNGNYKISKIQVGKKTEKHLYEYQTSTTRTESIYGHKVLSIDDCFAISNYIEIDMAQLCQAMEADQAGRFAGVDITQKILAPKHINTDHQRDIYQILSLKKDPLLNERFQKYPNPIAAINAFSFKIVQFNEDNLNGAITISNKLLRTIGLYTFHLDCQRRDLLDQTLDRTEQPYELYLQLQKVGMLQVKSRAEIEAEEDAKKADPTLGGQEIQHVKLLEWSEDYKSDVEKMWEDTLCNIRQFISGERRQDGKRSISLPPIGLSRLTTLTTKKKEMLKKKLSASQRHVPPPQPKPLESEGASLMFKKWAINQAIHLQQEGMDANTNAEMKTVNKYINRVLRSEQDTSDRVQELIKNAGRIKEASQRQHLSLSVSPGKEGRRVKTETEEEGTFTHLDNILRSSKIAKESNIRTYIHQRQSSKSPEDSRQDFKFSRQDTNKSQFTINLTEKGSVPLYLNKADVRAPISNTSKLSNHTTFTRKSGKAGNLANIEAEGGLDSKIKLKLEQLQDRSFSNPHTVQVVMFYTPDRQINGKPDSSFNMSRMKTEQSRYKDSSPDQKGKPLLRFTTEHTEMPANKLQSQVSFTLSPSQDMQSPPIKRSREEQNRFEEYKNNFSLLNYHQKEKEKQKQKEKEKEKGEQDTSRKAAQDLASKKQSAIERLKRSERLMSNVYLPEIASNKEKLMKKMKEKRSYVKTIQAHLNDSNIQTIRQGEKRKELIKKLYEFK